MAVSSGFFNSNNGDRKFDANDINDFFEGFVQEGVLGPVGGWLQVTAAGGMQVSVATGKAWFMNTWVKNSQPRTLDLIDADINFPRFDYVALDFDLDARQNSIIVINGTPSNDPSYPTLIDTATHKQYPLASIFVDAAVTSIDAGDITNLIGVAIPFATGLLQQATVADINTKWRAEFNAWMAQIESDLQQIDTSGTLVELEDIRQKAGPGRNIIINGDMRINQLGNTTVTDFDNVKSVSDPYAGIADRWCLNVGANSGSWTLSRRDLNNGFASYRGTVSTSTPATDAASNVIFQQRIEAARIAHVGKGTTDAKQLVLSWLFKTNRSGTYIVEIVDQDNTRHINKSIYHNGDGSFQEFTWVIPEDYTGIIDYDTGPGFYLNFWILAGSNYTGGGQLNTTWTSLTTNRRAFGQVNCGAAVNNYWEFTDIQLELGNKKTTFDRLPLDQQLTLCQRYREFYTQWVSGPCTGDTTSGDRIGGVGPNYRTQKRIIPTVTYTSVGWATVTGFLSDSFSAGSSFNLIHTSKDVTKDKPIFYVVPTTSITQDKAYFVAVSNLMIDAEL